MGFGWPIRLPAAFLQSRENEMVDRAQRPLIVFYEWDGCGTYGLKRPMLGGFCRDRLVRGKNGSLVNPSAPQFDLVR